MSSSVKPHLGVIGLVLVITAAPALAGHDKSDVCTLDDGSNYHGEIKSVQYATLNLKTGPVGLLSIEWRHVKSLTSKFEYRIELTGGVRHYGTLGPAKQPGHLSIVGSSGTIEVGLAEVFAILPIEHGFWKRLDGSVNFGASYTQANAAVQYNLSGDAIYRTRESFGALSTQSIFSTQTGGETTNQHQLDLVVAQAGKKKWGSFETGAVASNPDLGYDLRFLLGAGAANFLVESSGKLLAFFLGGVYNWEKVADDSEVDQSAEVLAGVSFRRFKRHYHSPSVQVDLTTFTNVTDTPRFRARFNFNLGWKIVSTFQVNFQVINNYDSDPPGTGTNNNDLSIVTSVGYTF